MPRTTWKRLDMRLSVYVTYYPLFRNSQRIETHAQCTVRRCHQHWYLQSERVDMMIVTISGQIYIAIFIISGLLQFAGQYGQLSTEPPRSPPRWKLLELSCASYRWRATQGISRIIATERPASHLQNLCYANCP